MAIQSEQYSNLGWTFQIQWDDTADPQVITCTSAVNSLGQVSQNPQQDYDAVVAATRRGSALQVLIEANLPTRMLRRNIDDDWDMSAFDADGNACFAAALSVVLHEVGLGPAPTWSYQDGSVAAGAVTVQTSIKGKFGVAVTVDPATFALSARVIGLTPAEQTALDAVVQAQFAGAVLTSSLAG